MKDNSRRPVWVEIDLSAIRNNFQLLREKLGSEVKIMPVVKADAYGHGAKRVASTLVEAGADRLAVAIPEEGVELREAGVSLPIQVLFTIPQEQYHLFFDYNLIATVSDHVTLGNLNKEALARSLKLKIHIVLDTGMGRQGFFLEEAENILINMEDYQGLELEGLMTHFASADEENKDYSNYQWEKLLKLMDKLKENKVDIPLKHAANSAAILNLPGFMLDMVRPGIISYGLSPSNGMVFDQDFRPALTWKAKISQLRKIPAGSPLSYGGTYTTKQDSLIATIPLGYADGYPRLLSNKGYLLIGGKKAPIRGRVCMDQLLVDVSDIPAVSIWDEVVLIGKQGDLEIKADDLAELSQTINYEIVCGISKRVPRKYIDKSTP